MAFSFSRFSRSISALLLALALSSILVFPAAAKSDSADFPGLNKFIESVSNGDASALRGVYVQDVMAFIVIQQPADSAAFVSLNRDQVTQFNMAAQAGNVGLLAHNYLAGNSFSKLKKGDVVTLVYGDGHTESFTVTTTLRYQALSPNSVSSNFKDLGSQAVLSASQLFDRVYRGSRHLTFQTCIEADGDVSWGRLFILAEPTRAN
jgi:hypothetical protein